MPPFPFAARTGQDVVEQMNHALEQQLREAEARFRTLVEEMPAIIYINAWDEPHPMLYVSPHVEEMLGYSSANWLERPGFVYSIVHPDDREALRAENERTEAIGARFSLEYRLISRTGRDVWVRDECVPVYDIDGHPLFYQGIMIDVSDRHRTEEALRDSEERFRGAFEDAAVAQGIATLDGHLLRVNAAHCDLLGYCEEELVGRDVRELIHPGDLASTHQRRAELLSGAIRSYKEERRYLHKNGHVVWGLVNLSLTRDAKGNPLTVLAQIQDITDRKRIEASLRESEGLFRGAFEYSMVGMTLSTPDGRYTRVNQAFCEMLGYSEAQLLDLSYDTITYPDDLLENRDHRARLLGGEIDHFQIEKRYCHADGHPVWTLLSVAIVRDSRGDPLYIIGQAQDISDRKEAEARLTYQAFHDSLTGLPNRALFQDRIGHALERARRNGERIAVMFLDLDGFKAVNDTYGHATGDQLLIALGGRLRGWVRAGDTVARLGGDEFTILLEDIGAREEATQIASRIIAGLETLINVDGRSLWVRASLGIAFNRPADITADDLLRNADIALYRAKHAGGGQYIVHDEDHIAPHIGTSELRATYS
jgi:diguanylate cyclase (GGDEF)-like protein/PAS domain S-box-containing protein